MPNLGAVVDNLPGAVPRVYQRRFVEQGADVYTWDLFVPAYALIENILVHGEALWAAATSAVLDVGDYTNATPPVAIQAQGFYTAINLKATDLVAGESIDFYGAGGKQGAYIADIAAPGSQILQRLSATDRILRSRVTSVGAGALGRTIVTVRLAVPVTVQASGVLFP